ncbi:hypothetical protein KC19_VG216900 [Ceratodon purpureus]|uniref:Uncharacterized protein n=1 Tax=Ceratodon purpureus TaxID=3225 RepID=A0A8T0HS86_CERPU|nr:hypothetical protein KC19_VG216900 [Ceratodon purpureus]
MCFMTARMADIGTDEPSNSDRPNLEFVASIGLFVCLGFKSLHFANPMCGGSFLVSVAVVTPGRELFYENTSKIVLDLQNGSYKDINTHSKLGKCLWNTALVKCIEARFLFPV